jgi:ferredoxin-thioredoxin reductase catalytic chain
MDMLTDLYETQEIGVMNMKVPTANNILLRLKRTADYYGYEINPNEKQRDAVIQGLINNLVKYGYPYCPCSIVKNIENMCPCDNLYKDIREKGMCRCRMFFMKKAEHGEDECSEPELGFC